MNKCGCCEKNVSTRTVYKLLCGLCGEIYHTQCMEVSKNVFRSMKHDVISHWICKYCVNMFPFNNIIDHELFSNCAKNNDIKLAYDNLLFNPFELYSDDDKSYICNDIDPDRHYYDYVSNSKYYDIDEFNSIASTFNHSKPLSMYCCNVRSATKNGNYLSNMLCSMNTQFDVVAITETWLTEQNHEIVGFPTYSHIYKCRETINEKGTTKIGGGVSLLVRSNLKFRELTEFTKSDTTIECIFVEIEMTGRNVIVGCIYRPPGNNLKNFNEVISDTLGKLNKINSYVYLLGDYNINLLNVGSHSLTNEFIDIMFSSSFIPLINRPTRITDDTATIIDNIFTNCHNTDHIAGIIPKDVSDHFPIFVLVCNQSKPQTAKIDKYRRIINDTTIQNCVAKLQLKDWNNILECTDPELAYDIFLNQLNYLINDTIPLKKIEENKYHEKPWITKGLRTSIINKNQLYKQMMVAGDKTLETKYKAIKNKLTNVLRQSEKNYYNNILDKNKNNLSKLWKTLNTVINRKKKHSIKHYFQT